MSTSKSEKQFEYERWVRRAGQMSFPWQHCSLMHSHSFSESPSFVNISGFSPEMMINRQCSTMSSPWLLLYWMGMHHQWFIILNKCPHFILRTCHLIPVPICLRYNVCVMAYGQTGSGKTHTMVGSHDNDLYNINFDPHPDEGIIPRAVRELFR